MMSISVEAGTPRESLSDDIEIVDTYEVACLVDSGFQALLVASHFLRK